MTLVGSSGSRIERSLSQFACYFSQFPARTNLVNVGSKGVPARLCSLFNFLDSKSPL